MLVVTGNGRILATPDEATVRLGIVRQAPAAQAAQDQVNAVAQQILNEIRKLSVLPEHVQTARLVLSPVYAPRSPESRDAPRIVAYDASNTVTVRLQNLALVGPVIDAGLKAGANQLEGVQFGLRNDLPSRQEALKQAVNEARSKADVMAQTLRVNLGEVLEVSEGGSGSPRFDMPLQGRVFAQAAAAPTPVSPGELEVVANVTIRYRISQR
ncbi:MAG: SIMPL domain-containing protein [Vicinamibacterales bacterium]